MFGWSSGTATYCDTDPRCEIRVSDSAGLPIYVENNNIYTSTKFVGNQVKNNKFIYTIGNQLAICYGKIANATITNASSIAYTNSSLAKMSICAGVNEVARVYKYGERDFIVTETGWIVGAEEPVVISTFVIPTISLPANTTYTIPSINTTFDCTGDAGAYLVNLSANGVNVITNQAILNATNYSYLQNYSTNGGWSLNLTCANGTIVNSTTLNFSQNLGLFAGINSPTNTTYNLSGIQLNTTCYGSFASYITNLSVDGTDVATNIPISNGTTISTGYSITSNGGHNLTAICWNATAPAAVNTTVYFTGNMSVLAQLNYPPDNYTFGSYGTPSIVIFNYSCLYGFASYNISMSLNGTEQLLDKGAPSGVSIWRFLDNISFGTYNWSITCANGTINNSGSYILHLVNLSNVTPPTPSITTTGGNGSFIISHNILYVLLILLPIAAFLLASQPKPASKKSTKLKRWSKNE